MSIIAPTIFNKTELKLPIDNIDDIQDYIDEHEPIILKKVLGYALYKEFIAALAGAPAQKWLDLRDGDEYTDTSDDLQDYEGIQQIIADYVFFEIVSNIQSYTTDSGVFGGATENSERSNPRYKQVFAYNDMVDRLFYMNGFINAANDATTDTYENFDDSNTTKLITETKTNVLNI